MIRVHPVGTTIYQPESCFNGYTLVSAKGGVKLITMNGDTAHGWPTDRNGTRGFIHRARLLANGHLMILVGQTDDTHGYIEEYDWDSRSVWQYTPRAGEPHHGFWPQACGSVLLICRKPIPEEHVQKARDPARRANIVYDDVLIEVSRAKEVVWEWHQHQHLDIDWCNPIPASRDWPAGPDNNTITDWTHTNTIQALPPNRWYDKGDERFKPGNVLISMRQLDTILIVDRDSGEIAWSYTGDHYGGMSGQHESHMIEKGIPGEGNIIVFDNGASPYKDLAHAGCSFVLEVNPVSKQVVWVYDDQRRFYSTFTSNCQRLPNGNTLIFETICRRIFEVTAEKEIVWEHVTQENAQRVFRYPYDFCPQTAALPKPKELPVKPPEELRIAPSL